MKVVSRSMDIMPFDESDWRVKALKGDYGYFDKKKLHGETDEFGMTPLSYAVLGRGSVDSDVLSHFLKCGDKEKKNCLGQTAYQIYLTISECDGLNENIFATWGYSLAGVPEQSSSLLGIIGSLLVGDQTTEERWLKERKRDYDRNFYAFSKEIEYPSSLIIENNRYINKAFEWMSDSKYVNEKLRLLESEQKEKFVAENEKDEFETTDEYNKRIEDLYSKLFPVVEYKGYSAKLDEDVLKKIIDEENSISIDAAQTIVKENILWKEIENVKTKYELVKIYMFPYAEAVFDKYDADNNIYTINYGRYQFFINIPRDIAKKIKIGEIKYDVIREIKYTGRKPSAWSENREFDNYEARLIIRTEFGDEYCSNTEDCVLFGGNPTTQYVADRIAE